MKKKILYWSLGIVGVIILIGLIPSTKEETSLWEAGIPKEELAYWRCVDEKTDELYPKDWRVESDKLSEREQVERGLANWEKIQAECSKLRPKE